MTDTITITIPRVGDHSLSVTLTTDQARDVASELFELVYEAEAFGDVEDEEAA